MGQRVTASKGRVADTFQTLRQLNGHQRITILEGRVAYISNILAHRDSAQTTAIRELIVEHGGHIVAQRQGLDGTEATERPHVFLQITTYVQRLDGAATEWGRAIPSTAAPCLKHPVAIL